MGKLGGGKKEDTVRGGDYFSMKNKTKIIDWEPFFNTE